MPQTGLDQFLDKLETHKTRKYLCERPIDIVQYMKRSLHIQIYASRLMSYRKNYKRLLRSEQKSVWSEWLWKGYKNFVSLSMQLRLWGFIFLLPFLCNAELNETFL